MDETGDELERLRALLETCRQGVVFTGAGISTESGIPDYRGPGGIWKSLRPIDYQEFLSSAEARRAYWRRKFSTGSKVEGARPNAGHVAVAELVRRGSVACVITQNVDGLHQKSGVPGERVIELHGNTTFARCLSCRERYELGPIEEAFAADETLPVCRLCGGHVKSATISFGQPMPREEMRRAEEATTAADVFLAIGSSLGVYPAAGFPVLAKRHGAALVIVNREPTPLDGVADLVLNREIGPTLGALVRSRSAGDAAAG